MPNMKRNEPEFRIENHILKGKEVELPNDYTSLGKFILDKFKNNLDNVGQVEVTTETEDTYREMMDRSVRCALWMRKQGIVPGDVIAICSHNHLDTAIPCYAALYIGAAFNPFDPSMKIKDMKHVMGITKPKMAFVDEASAKTVALTAKEADLDLKIIVFGNSSDFETFSQALAAQNDAEVNDFQCTEIENPDHISMVICSSGTTGMPKGVAHSHSSIIKQMQSLGMYDLSERSILLSFSNLYWFTGSFAIFASVTSNAKRIVPPVFEEDSACRIIEKFKVTWVSMGPSIMNRLLKSDVLTKYDLSCVEAVWGGGGIMSRQSLEMLASYLRNAVVSITYGMTELGGVVVAQKKNHKPGSSGVIVDNVQMKVVDLDTRQILGPNMKGELCFKSPSVMTGYYGNPQATEEIIDKEGWLHSGDIGFYDDDGEIFIVDRIKVMIAYRDYRVSPAEIENVLHNHVGVKEAAVCGVPHETEMHPMAFVVRTPDSKVTERELMDLVAAELVDAKKLRGGVKFMDQLPLTPSGKINRKELSELAKTLANGR